MEKLIPRVAAFERTAALYDLLVAHGPLQRARRRSIEALDLRDGQRVFIPGAGTGLDFPLLPKGIRGLAGDLSPAMLRRAETKRHQLGLEGLEVRPFDAQCVEVPDGTFDAAILHLILAVAPDGQAVLAEASRLVRPGGRLTVLDKFLPPQRTRPEAWRRWLAACVAPFTDLNRRFEHLSEGLPLTVASDSPVLLRGNFRQILLTRN